MTKNDDKKPFDRIKLPIVKTKLIIKDLEKFNYFNFTFLINK